jgi:hypothetical protein
MDLTTPDKSTVILAVDNSLAQESPTYRALMQALSKDVNCQAITVVRANGEDLAGAVTEAQAELASQGVAVTKVVALANAATVASVSQLRDAFTGTKERVLLSVDIEQALKASGIKDLSEGYMQLIRMFNLALLIANDRDAATITEYLNGIGYNGKPDTQFTRDEITEILKSGGLVVILPKIRRFDPAEIAQAHNAAQAVLTSM